MGFVAPNADLTVTYDHDVAFDADVCDAVGELANMVAGAAKAQLEQLSLSLSIPNVVSGPQHKVHYPSNVQPVSARFESEIGDFAVEFGFTPVSAV